MVIDAALGEQSNILEAMVVLDDVIKIAVTFSANVLESFDVEANLGRVLRATFGVDFAMFDDWLEP